MGSCSVYVCQMLEDHKRGHQIFQFLLLAVFCRTFPPSANWCQTHFHRKSRSAGQLLSLRMTGFANWDLKRIQDLSCKYLHRYRVVTALKSKSGGREMAYGTEGLCIQKDLERKRTILMASPLCHLGLPLQVLSAVFSGRSRSEAWWHQWKKSPWYKTFWIRTLSCSYLKKNSLHQLDHLVSFFCSFFIVIA